jgi:pyruvate dehydrogenase E2 component (dihydrolipoamide acetyltransferase)
MTDVRMPELGETITQGTITRWFKEVGDTVAVEEALFEVSTEKVDAEVPSPIAGTVTKILIALGETVDVGAVVAQIDAVGAEAAPMTQPAIPAPAPAIDVPGASAKPALLVTSPIVRKLINDLGSDAKLVNGTGPDGRVTRQDAEKVAFSADHLNTANVQGTAEVSRPARLASAPVPEGANFVPFNKTRKITGDRMVISKATSPHVMTATEVDYERIESVRRKYQEQWRRTEGFTLTYLPFICRAVVQVLREFPYLNASVAEGGLALHDHVDLNIAIDLNYEGLLAPVVRHAEDKRLGAIAREIADLATRARASKLRTEELIGGTFTLSNSGPFGTFMVAPVINQPQVAILSTDGVTRKLVVLTDAQGGEAIAIHSMGMLVLSWDHRAFDGAYAAAFLRSLKEVLENNSWESEF